MNRVVAFVGGLVLGGIVFGFCGTFFGYRLANSSKPAVVVHNVTAAAIPKLNIHTDVGESYVMTDLTPKKPQRLKISGREKALWITATLPSGKTLTSEHIYTTSEGVVFVIVSDDAVVLDYEL